MNTYEVVNLRGEVKTLRGTSGLDALLRAGLNPKEWATIRATLGVERRASRWKQFRRFAF